MARCLGNRRRRLAQWRRGRHRKSGNLPFFVLLVNSTQLPTFYPTPTERKSKCHNLFTKALRISSDHGLPRIEGVNDMSPNAMTLHTGANCNMPASRTMTGVSTATNCDVNTDGNTGCGVQATSANNYGPSFNANGGGWYAMERTNTFIKVWFWPRNGGSPPSDVSSGSGSINTDAWVCAQFSMCSTY